MGIRSRFKVYSESSRSLVVFIQSQSVSINEPRISRSFRRSYFIKISNGHSGKFKPRKVIFKNLFFFLQKFRSAPSASLNITSISSFSALYHTSQCFTSLGTLNLWVLFPATWIENCTCPEVVLRSSYMRFPSYEGIRRVGRVFAWRGSNRVYLRYEIVIRKCGNVCSEGKRQTRSFIVLRVLRWLWKTLYLFYSSEILSLENQRSGPERKFSIKKFKDKIIQVEAILALDVHAE